MAKSKTKRETKKQEDIQIIEVPVKSGISTSVNDKKPMRFKKVTIETDCGLKVIEVPVR